MKSIHQNSFSLIEGEDHLSSYKWNKHIAEHFFCRACGVYTHHKRRRYPDQISVNFACLDNLALPNEMAISLVNGAGHG